jgi:hypothetical protein
MKWGVAVLVGVSLLVGCAVPAPTPSPTAPPTAQPAADLAAQIAAVTASVPGVRELQPTRDVPSELITREQFQANVEELFNSESTPEERAAEERFYKRMGLLAQDADMGALINQLYGSQVAAYYNPDDGKFYVIRRDSAFNATDKIIVAHEYTHALQDQHFDLKNNTITDNSQGDKQLAQLAVIEGDATLTSQLWATDNLGLADMLQMLIDGFSELDQASLEGVPLILRRQLEFPYTEGFEFATALHDKGGYDDVNAAITTPPLSTEQIIHPDKYFAHEAPVDIPGVPVPDVLGCTAMAAAYSQTLGELGIQIIAAGDERPQVDIPGFPADWPHADVAAGWAGDRLVMYEGCGGKWSIIWKTVWDTDADAISFRSRMDELSSQFAGTTDLQINGDTVDVEISGS